MRTLVARSAVMIADLRGAILRGFREDSVDVRDTALPIDHTAFERDCASFAATLSHDETTLAPRAVNYREGGVDLALEVSQYSAYRAAALQFGALDEALRQAALAEGPQWQFSHSLGVNVTLQTADGLFVIVRRASTVDNARLLAPPMNEGANVEDLIDGQWAPATTAYRGFEEEWALKASEICALRFHSLVSQFDTGAISVLGHARTVLTFEQLLRRHRSAQDRAEVAQIFALGVHELRTMAGLDSPQAWVSWGSLALAGMTGAA